jgi:hypothetical protein
MLSYQLSVMLFVTIAVCLMECRLWYFGTRSNPTDARGAQRNAGFSEMLAVPGEVPAAVKSRHWIAGVKAAEDDGNRSFLITNATLAPAFPNCSQWLAQVQNGR